MMQLLQLSWQTHPPDCMATTDNADNQCRPSARMQWACHQLQLHTRSLAHKMQWLRGSRCQAGTAQATVSQLAQQHGSHQPRLATVRDRACRMSPSKGAGQLMYLVHGSSRGHSLHDVLAATIGAHWEATSDDLAQSGQVWGDAKVLLCAALCYPACTSRFSWRGKTAGTAVCLGSVRQLPLLRGLQGVPSPLLCCLQGTLKIALHPPVQPFSSWGHLGHTWGPVVLAPVHSHANCMAVGGRQLLSPGPKGQQSRHQNDRIRHRMPPRSCWLSHGSQKQRAIRGCI